MSATAVFSSRCFTDDVPGISSTFGATDNVHRSIDASLERLGTDVVDLYYYHRPDGVTPLVETLGAMQALVAAGKVRALGLSNVDEALLREAEASGVQVAAVQNRYSITNQGSERVREECEKRGIAFIPWFPLDAGGLAKPGGPLDVLAKEHGATEAQLVLAWLLWRSGVMLPYVYRTAREGRA